MMLGARIMIKATNKVSQPTPKNGSVELYRESD